MTRNVIGPPNLLTMLVQPRTIISSICLLHWKLSEPENWIECHWIEWVLSPNQIGTWRNFRIEGGVKLTGKFDRDKNRAYLRGAVPEFFQALLDLKDGFLKSFFRYCVRNPKVSGCAAQAACNDCDLGIL